jgi:hypothetical protein
MLIYYRPILKSRTLHESPTRSTRNSKNELISSLRQFNGPVPWIIGEGGFGTLALLPKEIRQYIYGYAFRVDRAVQVRECCGPDATKRERDACQKHGIGTKQGADRFNLFHLSKAIKEEASWVVFNQGSLRLPVSNAIAPYLNGYRAKSLRHIPGFAQHDQHKTAMWTTAARFRFVTIEISEPVLRYGNPPMYTNHLLGITILLCNTKNPPSLRDAVSLQPRTIQVHIGSLFHQMLPFNMESQAEARYGELLDWLFVHSPCAEPDFDKIAAESGHNLQRMVRIVSRHSERSQWKVLVDMQLDEKDDGGCKALQAFQTGCAQNGLSLEHLHQPLG